MTGDPAVVLACPDAMIFYSGLPDGAQHLPGWVYVYAKPDAFHTIANPAYANYVLEADVVPFSFIEAGNWFTDSRATNPTWAAACGTSSGTLTSATVTPPASPLAILAQIFGVYGPAPAATCTGGDSAGSPGQFAPCSGPQIFANEDLQAPGTYNSGYIDGYAAGNNADGNTDNCTFTSTQLAGQTAAGGDGLACTTDADSVAGVYFSVEVRSLACKVCNDEAVSKSPPTVVHQEVTMDNVALAIGFGAGMY